MSERALYSNTVAPAEAGWLAKPLLLGLSLSTVALVGIILLAAALRFVNIDAIGDGNTYYTAAVTSMLQSWENFFFVAAEPGGSVTVDKPPLGLWLQAVSASVFGVSGFSVALPQILAGIFSIPLLYHLVKRHFGEGAGLVAALILAITPVAIAVERNNTMDATLMFTLLLAAWAFLEATEQGKRGWLLLGAVLVGLAFNIKMLQAFLPVPAFYALYLLGSEEGWGRKVVNLILASLVLLAVSLSWAITVDLTPADQRPYIGSRSNNSVME
ncbi:MAG: phospholipid carrier-dependent glycosyltransferase, partial [Chloroflexi bacterium]|nr:phospholipid carrier-dependent glycosyltransferase [Chloroflexota bacterium]